MADRHSDEALTRIPPHQVRPTPEQMAHVEEARKRVEECAGGREHWFEQRDSDSEFIESQFTEAQRNYRMRTDRPALEVNLLDARKEAVMHDWRAADMGVRIGAAMSSGGEDAARFYNGLLQRMLRESRFRSVLQQTVEDGVMLGEGWCRWAVVRAGGDEVVEKLWDGRDWTLEDAVGVNHRELRLKYVKPEDVWPDPFAVEPDRRDMQWLIETRWMTREQRDRQFPNAYREPVESFRSSRPGDERWYRKTPGGLERDRMVRIAYYWRRSEEEQEYVFLPEWREGVRRDRLTAEQEQAVAAAPEGGIVTRKVMVPKVELSVVDGRTVLLDWVKQPMTRIPYARTMAREVRYVNGEVVPRGLVSILRGLTFWMSVMASDTAWQQATMGLDYIVATDDAIDGFREDWENQDRPSRIKLYNQWERNPIPGQEGRQNAEPKHVSPTPNLEPNMLVMDRVGGLVSAVSGTSDQSAQTEQAGWRSGMGLERIAERERANRDRALFNAQHVLLNAIGESFLDCRWVFGETGRIVQIGSESPGDADQGAVIGVPFVHEPGKMLPTALHGLPDEVRTIPYQAPPAPDGTPAAPATLKVHRFNPITDRVKVSTHSTGMAKRLRDSKAEILMQLSQAAEPGPMKSAMIKSALRAIGDVLPMDDVLRVLDVVSPDPVEQGETDVNATLARLGQALMEIQNLQQQNQQLQAAADQMAGAERIESMKAEQRATTAAQVSDTRAASNIEVAKIRAEAQTESAETEAEGRIEAEVVRASSRSDDQDRKQTGDAVIAGMKEGARSGGRNPGNAGG